MCVLHCVPPLSRYNSDIPESTLISFDRNVTEKIGNQKVLYFSTYFLSNICAKNYQTKIDSCTSELWRVKEVTVLGHNVVSLSLRHCTGSRWCGGEVIAGDVVSHQRTTDDEDTVIDVVGCDMATSGHVISR